jgi:hypothetical protein
MKMTVKNPRRIKEVKIVVSVLTMKEYREERCIVPLLFNIGSREL